MDFTLNNILFYMELNIHLFNKALPGIISKLKQYQYQCKIVDCNKVEPHYLIVHNVQIGLILS